MSFCKLPEGQVAALVFIKAITSSDKAPQQVKDLVASRDWHTLAVAVSLANPGKPVPNEGDFANVGNLPQGQQDVNFVLAMVDAQGTDQAKQQLQSALDTHCWDQVAGGLSDAMTSTGIRFSGADLHQAYAPGDNSPCTGPSDLDKMVGEIVRSGQLVGTFFSQSLPDFFANGFGKVSDFFTGDFAGFFTNVGEQIGHGFEQFADDVKSTLEKIGEKLNPSNW